MKELIKIQTETRRAGLLQRQYRYGVQQRHCKERHHKTLVAEASELEPGVATLRRLSAKPSASSVPLHCIARSWSKNVLAGELVFVSSRLCGGTFVSMTCDLGLVIKLRVLEALSVVPHVCRIQ